VILQVVCYKLSHCVAVLICYCTRSCAVNADDKDLRSSEPYFTAEEPLSAANIAEKLQNKFVNTAVDTDNAVEGVQFIINCRYA